MPLTATLPAPAATAHWTDLLEVLERCATRVPLYRGVASPALDAGGTDPEAAARAALAAFPVLERAALRAAFPHGLVPAGVDLAAALRAEDVWFVGTSGTTGERLQVLWHQPWWDAQERGGFALHPLTDEAAGAPGYREAILTTPVCSGTVCHVGRRSMDDRTRDGRQLFLNEKADPGLWTDDDVRRMADELDVFQPHALEGDPAYLAVFAARLVRLGRRPWQPRFVDVSYSMPSRRHVAAIGRAFDAPVLDAYGSTECGFAFMECARGRRHENHAWLHAEVLPLDGVAGLEGCGRLLLTPLGNPWLNLVRFDTGDLVRVASGPCPCGNARGPSLLAIEGRAADLVVAADGRLVTPRGLDQALSEVDGLLHWRLVQRGPREADLDLLPTGLEPLDVAGAADAVTRALGFAPRTRAVSTIAPEASGKLRLAHAAHADLAARVRVTA